ncbi:MAG: protein kinase [bacterium]|nr:protein kinase [bacterium]
MIGRTIAQYKILEQLGSGGMGSVYKAVDEGLDRPVALKILPRGLDENHRARTRFEQEAQAVSALDHPNICTIYQIGKTSDGLHFIAMAYYEGETVSQMLTRSPLLVGEAAGIAAQVAGGLHAAHQRGIVHRDVKPANIVVTEDGQAKILDFGVAKLTGGADITQEGSIVGTAVYMSPEQTSGAELDHRTDVWSMGVLLYQMVTGKLPFPGDDLITVQRSILLKEPEPVTTIQEPEGSRLKQILARALAKAPEDRYHDMREMQKDLEALALHVTVPTHSTIARQEKEDEKEPSTAVLPFVDLSPEKDQEYFCCGIAEELICLLTGVENLRVASRASAFHSFSRTDNPRLIGRQLNVDTVLEGSVRTAGNRLRVTARLLEVSDGSYLWSEKYDREISDLFDIQDEIAGMIVDALQPTLMKRSRLLQPRHSTDNIDAYFLYLKGRYQWKKRTIEGLTKGIGYFQQAITEEPGYARAYAGLADSYVMLGIYGFLPPDDVMPRAKAAAEKALEINDSLAEVYTSRACVRSVYDWDFAGAESDFQRAVELDPSYATAYQWKAMNYLIPLGRFEEANEQLRQAWELDPLSLTINTSRGLYYYYCRRYREAVDEFRRALEIDADFEPAHVFLGQTYDKQGLYEEALAELRQALKLSGGRPDITVALGHAHAQLGHRDLARCFLDQLLHEAETKYVSPSVVAQVHAALGEREEALAALEQARTMRSADLIWLGVNPVFDPLLDEPGFRSLLNEIGLEVHTPADG